MPSLPGTWAQDLIERLQVGEYVFSGDRQVIFTRPITRRNQF
jgi:hypothetical protein